MNKLILLILCLSLTVDAQWELCNNGIQLGENNGWAMDAIDSSNAVVSYGQIYKTADGGLNWFQLQHPSSAVDIVMIDPQTIIFGDDEGKIYKSTDGGSSWQLTFHDSTLTEFINYIEFFDATNAVAMGDGISVWDPAAILVSTDGGNSWLSKNEGSFSPYSGDIWRRLDFVNTNTGYFYASGGITSGLFKTTNGGIYWQYLSLIGGLGVLKFYDENIGFFNSTDGSSFQMKKTTDGGASWNIIPGFNQPVADLEFLPGDQSKIWSGTWEASSGRLFFSNDEGLTWNEENLSLPAGVRDIEFTDYKTGWLLCDNGYVYRNLNGNVVISVNDPVIKPEFNLFQNFPNPFNPVTKIRYSVPALNGNEAAVVKLAVYDLTGRKVSVLVDGIQEPGFHEEEFDGSSLASGIYFYSLQHGEFNMVKKLLLLK